MNGPKHAPYPEWVEEAVRDHYDRIAEAVASDALLTAELGSAIDDARAALREVGVADA